MASMKSPLRLCASIALFCLHVQAQVTGEGGSISGVAGTSAQVTQTASQGTGSPTNYYSSVHPQITLPSSAEPSKGLPVSGGSSTNSSLSTGVIVAIAIALVISITLVCATLYLLRRRMQRSSTSNNSRAAWIINSGQWRDGKNHNVEAPPFKSATDTPVYPFAMDGPGGISTPPPAQSSQRL